MRLAADAELDLAVHAIGDAAVRSVLDVYERRARLPAAAPVACCASSMRSWSHPDDVPRFAQLGVIASMQPIHATCRLARGGRALGRTRARHGYAWRDCCARGATLAFGTDAPVEAHRAAAQPARGDDARVTRTANRPDGWYAGAALSLEEAAARVYRRLGRRRARGTARRGSLAPAWTPTWWCWRPIRFRCRSDALRETRVMMTMVGGRITFEGG